MYIIDSTNETYIEALSVGWDLRLDSIKFLLMELQNPQDKVKTIHVTGTNGKGSICAYLSNIIQAAGYSVGRYTSPAIEDELERFCINGISISKERFVELWKKLSVACKTAVHAGLRHPSLFEIETALAFLYFYEEKCDIAIIEVGMGGSLDATNVIKNPSMCIFSSIGLDHTNWLGDNITDITRNKAAIIKKDAIVISAPQEDKVKKVLDEICTKNGNKLYYANSLSNFSYSLKGGFQKINSAVASTAAIHLNDIGIEIPYDSITYGLNNTVWKYRFEQIIDEPVVILDGAHNIPAINCLKESIMTSFKNKSFTFIISVLKDKDYEKMFNIICPIANNIIFLESPNERALSKEEFENTLNSIGLSNYTYGLNATRARDLALEYNNDVIVCFGTFTFLSDIRKVFLQDL